jgi:hypothetical protein
MDDYALREYVDTHLILSEARGNSAGAVCLDAERDPKPQRRLLNLLTLHAKVHRIRDASADHPSTVDPGRQRGA